MTFTLGAGGDEGARRRAVSEAARIRRRYPGWDVQAVRVHRGWSVQAVPESDNGRASVVIGPASEVEAAVTSMAG